MDGARVGGHQLLQCLHQLMLALVHLLLRPLQVGGRGGTGHGGGEQHAGAERTAQPELITGLQPALGPEALGRNGALHAEADL